MLIKKDQDVVKGYLEDSSNLKGGYADEVMVPSDIGELSLLLRERNCAGAPVTISGGGTATTGSRIPFGGAIISLERLNRIVDISPRAMSATVQAGVFVEELKRACDTQGLFYTSHPTESTATVAGTVATNASGARSFKYGPMRGYVRRLKMVLADGEVMDLKRGDRVISQRDNVVRLSGGRQIAIPIPTYRMPSVKSSAGYFAEETMDLIDLFIGQEGTLSVIAEVELALVAKPERIFSAFVFFKKREDAWAFSSLARRLSRGPSGEKGKLIDALSIEYFDTNALALLRAKNGNVPENAQAAIFFEQETRAASQDDVVEAWMRIMAECGAGLDDTWVAMNEKDAAEFAGYRYAIPEAVNDALRRRGLQKLSTDIAVPEPGFPEMLRYYCDTLEEAKIEHVIFGHIGECHLHVNILAGSDEETRRAREIALRFVKKGVSLGGTVSAEHGIGKIKHAFLEEMYGRPGILEMARVKKTFDPNCILGLGNIFPKEILGLV